MKFINSSILKVILLGVVLAASTGPASAITISGTEVGDLDDVLGSAALGNSSPASEETALEAAIGAGADVTFVSKDDSPTFVTDGTNSYVDVSPDEPGFYVLKFGVGNCQPQPNCTPIPDTYFLENNSLLTFLAWANSELIAAGLPENHVLSLSHYTLFDGENGGGGGTPGTPSVPEPASILLVASGLIALRSLARRFHKN